MMKGETLQTTEILDQEIRSSSGSTVTKRNMLICSVSALLLVLGLGLNRGVAQDRITVTGTVTDGVAGFPLPGVNVVVQGSEAVTGITVGTTTNPDGVYSVNVPEGLNTLVFSFIGYIRQTVEIDGRTQIDVQLQPDIQLLDDIVVVGYGLQERREITSAISSIDTERFITGNINDAQQLLQGKIAGLVVSKRGADPEEGYTLRLRGLSTIGANAEPLVVIDGVIGADFNSVDPNDIASIDVLKDASAAAIYGTRGSSGVILITTKSGEAVARRGITVNYNGQGTTQIVANKMEMLTTEEYRNLPNTIPGTAIADHGASTDWFDEVTQQAYSTQHSLAISGGDAQTSYRVSGNYRDVQGIQKGSASRQLNARLNISHRTMDDLLTLTGNVAVTDRRADVGRPEVFRYATVSNPTAPVRDAEGEFEEIPGFDIYNPVAINELNTIDTELNRFVLSLRGEFEFRDLIDGLSTSVFYSREASDFFRGEYRSKRLRWGDGAGRNGLAFRELHESSNQLFETLINYRNVFSAVRLESVAGYSYQEFENQGQGASGGDFPSDAVLYHNLSQSGDFNEGRGDVWSYRNTNKLIAFFGRANFTIDNSYFLSGTIRQEGSTRFGEGNKWGTFFALGAGAELTDIISIPRADQFKVRLSYGETGQDAPASGLSQLRFGTGASFLVDGTFVPSLSPVGNPNPDLKWEIKREVNAGLDFSFFDGRFGGSLDLYSSVTDDLLLEFIVPVPPNLSPLQWVNIGQISNRGIEAFLDYVAIRRPNLNWRTSLTFATSETILESLSTADLEFGDQRLISNVGSPGLNDTQIIRVREGRPIGEIWGKRFAGFGPNGEWLFFDRNGNVITSGEATEADDQVIGNGMPTFQIGWDNSFRFRNWDLNFFWRGALGHDLVNTYNIFYQNPTIATAWNPTRSTLDIPELKESPQFSSFYVEDASYMRLENLTLGYTFDMAPGSRIRDLRVYVSGNNLWTITGYSGIDPEVRFFDTENVGGLGPLAAGIERRDQWFTQTSFVVGINLGL